MLHHKGVDALGVSQKLAHTLGIGDGMNAIGKSHGTRFAQHAEFGHLLTIAAFCQGAIG